MSETQIYAAAFDRLRQQLSLEYNCTPADLLREENILTVSRLQVGRRMYSPVKCFFQMVTTGVNAVVTADERLHPFLREFIKDRPGHFYGTSVSNYHSWNIAINSGFRPAWVEIGAQRKVCDE